MNEVEQPLPMPLDRLRIALAQQAGERRQQMLDAMKQNGVPIGLLTRFLNGDDDALAWEHVVKLVQWVRGEFVMMSSESGWVLRSSKTGPAVALGTRAPAVKQGKRYEAGIVQGQPTVTREASGKDLPSGSIEDMKRRLSIEAQQAELAERKKQSESKPLFGLGWR